MYVSNGTTKFGPFPSMKAAWTFIQTMIEMTTGETVVVLEITEYTVVVGG